RTITTVTPAGPAFFCAPAYRTPYRDTSVGLDRKSLDASPTSTTRSGNVGVSGNSTPWIVSLVVMWTYAGSRLIDARSSSSVGTLTKFSASSDQTTFALPCFRASGNALPPQEPVMT